MSPSGDAALVVASVLLASAAALVLPHRRRLSRLPAHAPRDPAPLPVTEPTWLLLRLRPVIAALAVGGGWSLVGGAPGLALGGVAAVVTWRMLGAAESPTQRRRRERLERDLPLGVDLLAACVRSGAAVETGLVAVADALDGPLGEELRAIHHRLRLGLDPVSVWREVAADPVLAPLGRAVARSHESGAAIADAVDALATDLRERSRTDAQVRVKAVEVNAAVPLAACFLPAFVLLGIVPVIAAVVSDLTIFAP